MCFYFITKIFPLKVFFLVSQKQKEIKIILWIFSSLAMSMFVVLGTKTLSHFKKTSNLASTSSCGLISLNHKNILYNNSSMQWTHHSKLKTFLTFLFLDT